MSRPNSPFPTVAPQLLALALLVLTGCATAPQQPAPPTAPPTAFEVEHLEERALLLLVADRLKWEPFSISQGLEGNAALRRRVAFTLGRLGDRRGGPPLEALLGDDSPEVRRAAAFSLGELGEEGYRNAARSLLGAVLDDDRTTGHLAVEALAKMGVTLETVVERLAVGPSEEILPRLTPSLFRFESSGVVGWAKQGLELSHGPTRAMAVYGLAREPRPEGREALLGLLADEDPWIRGMAARGIGRVGQRGDLTALQSLLDDVADGPRIQALRSARALVDAGVEAPPDDWIPRLLEFFDDPRPGVRAEALSTSSAWLLDEALGEALGARATTGPRRERELALLALAEGGDPRAGVLLLRFANESDPALRRIAARAAGFFRAAELLERLAEDDSPGVRVAALETRLLVAGSEGGSEDAAVALATAALEDPDPVVRATALSWAQENPLLPAPTLLSALDRSRRDHQLDARLAGVDAVAARAEAEPLERGALIAALEVLSRDSEYLVRRRTGPALRGLGREAPALGSLEGDRPVSVYRQIVGRTAEPRFVKIHTEAGHFTVQLACPQAPLTCLNFLQLVNQGFYDNLEFHRVVPDFVVQGGDPRGDGAGGPGYTLRDEVGLLRFDRAGILGMAHSGPDTAGSQFFFTLSAQPHLNGAYTAFGRVVSGLEVLHLLAQGDRITRAVETSGP